ncbi:hypothetical protein BASA83_008752 [Batrachochytrium salamandrivorans]|nr:hypothetical protein BASA83_008752 [Batrachochytrium salamandrivorans]
MADSTSYPTIINSNHIAATATSQSNASSSRTAIDNAHGPAHGSARCSSPLPTIVTLKDHKDHHGGVARRRVHHSHSTAAHSRHCDCATHGGAVTEIQPDAHSATATDIVTDAVVDDPPWYQCCPTCSDDNLGRCDSGVCCTPALSFTNNINSLDNCNPSGGMDGLYDCNSAVCVVHPSASLDSLPLELLLAVFVYLEPAHLFIAAQVCHFWYRTAFDGTLWTSLDATTLGATTSCLKSIIMRGSTFLRSLAIKPGGMYNFTDIFFLVTSVPTGSLESLSIQELPVSYAARLSTLLLHSPKLSRLNLSRSQLDELPARMYEWCPQICALDLSFSKLASIKSIIVASSLQHLSYLNLSRCLNLSNASFVYIAHLRSLETLNISFCPQIENTAFIQYQQELARLSDALQEETRVSSIHGLTPMTSPIRHLNVSSCTQLTLPALASIAQCMPHLETLELAGCSRISDEAITALCERCIHITHLDLEDCIHMTDLSLAAITAHLSQTLAVLIVNHCIHLSEPQLLDLMVSCTSLARIELDTCLVSDRLLSDMAARISVLGMHLVQVSLLDCRGVSAAGILNLIRTARLYQRRRISSVRGTGMGNVPALLCVNSFHTHTRRMGGGGGGGIRYSNRNGNDDDDDDGRDELGMDNVSAAESDIASVSDMVNVYGAPHGIHGAFGPFMFASRRSSHWRRARSCWCVIL